MFLPIATLSLDRDNAPPAAEVIARFEKLFTELDDHAKISIRLVGPKTRWAFDIASGGSNNREDEAKFDALVTATRHHYESAILDNLAQMMAEPRVPSPFVTLSSNITEADLYVSQTLSTADLSRTGGRSLQKLHLAKMAFTGAYLLPISPMPGSLAAEQASLRVEGQMPRNPGGSTEDAAAAEETWPTEADEDDDPSAWLVVLQ